MGGTLPWAVLHTENTIPDQALDTIKTLPVMTELDTEPTEDDLSKAIDSLKNGKAPGKDAIPPEVIKHGKHALLHHLHVLLLLCWREGTVPQDMRDANIVTLYKNKGDRSDCNTYRGISLPSVVGKVFARVALTKLQILAERTLPDSQCGFRTGRSTIDMIFSVRQLQEKCREQRRPLFIAFIDLTNHLTSLAGEDYSIYWRKLAVPRNYWVWSLPSITTWREQSTMTEQHPNHSISTVL